jgi:hypothetical protein
VRQSLTLTAKAEAFELVEELAKVRTANHCFAKHYKNVDKQERETMEKEIRTN